MIMDEVLAVGDMAFQTKCLTKMRDVAKKDGRTVLYVSHNMNTIRTLCERCIVLNKGRVIFDGDVEDAIHYYMKTDSDNKLNVYFDYTKNEREYQFGKIIFVNSLRLLNKEIARYKVNEKIQFELNMKTEENVDNVRVIVRIKDEDNVTKIAATLSECFSVKDFENIMRFALDTKGLVEDKYCLSFEIIKQDSAGNYYSYDNPYAKIPIVLTEGDTEKIFWSKKYWGNIKLDDIKLLP